MDYVREEDLEAFITSAIDKALNGIAGSRVPNHLVMNPDFIELDIIVLKTGGMNQVETDSVDTPAESTDTQSDTPAIINDVTTDVEGPKTSEETRTPGTRTTTTQRSGSDGSDTTRGYEEFED